MRQGENGYRGMGLRIKSLKISPAGIKKKAKITYKAETKEKIKKGYKQSKWTILFSSLEVGESFSLPFTDMDDATKVKKTTSWAISKYRGDKEFTIRILYLKNEVRVWRDK